MVEGEGEISEHYKGNNSSVSVIIEEDAKNVALNTPR